MEQEVSQVEFWDDDEDFILGSDKENKQIDESGGGL